MKLARALVAVVPLLLIACAAPDDDADDIEANDQASTVIDPRDKDFAEPFSSLARQQFVFKKRIDIPSGATFVTIAEGNVNLKPGGLHERVRCYVKLRTTTQARRWIEPASYGIESVTAKDEDYVLRPTEPGDKTFTKHADFFILCNGPTGLVSGHIKRILEAASVQIKKS